MNKQIFKFRLITLIITAIVVCGFTSYKSTSVLPEELKEGRGEKSIYIMDASIVMAQKEKEMGIWQVF